jgi:hypothetical protein
MHKNSWRSAILLDLAAETAPRSFRPKDLYKLIQHHHGQLPAISLEKVKEELLSLNVIYQVNEGVFLNLLSTPPICTLELAHYLCENSYVSLQTVLIDNDIIRCGWTDKEFNIISSVTPNQFFNVFDNKTISGGCSEYSFHQMPANFFPPDLADLDDVIDYSKSYPCFTPEKALLDYLVLEKSTCTCTPSFLNFDVSRLNMEKLLKLSNRLGIRGLLDECLRREDESIDRRAYVIANTQQTANREISSISDMLRSLRLAWNENPDLSFSQMLMFLRPGNTNENLLHVTDGEWMKKIERYNWTQAIGKEP